MPEKIRHPKRRLDPQAERAAWAMYLRFGRDYHHDLTTIGIETPSGAAARDAWREYGEALMQEWAETDPGRREPWALQQFGEP